jgi:hypothetical protein
MEPLPTNRRNFSENSGQYKERIIYDQRRLYLSPCHIYIMILRAFLGFLGFLGFEWKRMHFNIYLPWTNHA